jgi:hypothetical protein
MATAPTGDKEAMIRQGAAAGYDLSGLLRR